MRKTFRFFKWSGKKAVVLFILTVLLLVAAVDITIAFLALRTDSIENRYPAPDFNIENAENTIINSGDVPMYARAATVLSWVSQADQNTILSQDPVYGVDYMLEYNTDEWILASDGFYYYKKAIPPKSTVEGNNDHIIVFLTGGGMLKPKEGYDLRLRILSSGIQAEPIEAIESSWPAVTVNPDGTLSAK